MTDMGHRGAEAAMLEVITSSVECDPSRCHPAKCFCRRQVSAILALYRVRRRKARDEGDWTPARDERLREMRAQTDAEGRRVHTTDSMAEELGVSRWAIKRRVKKLRLPAFKARRRHPSARSGSGPV